MGLLYLYSGEYNVAATDPHAEIVSWALETGQVQSVKSHAEELEITLPTDSATLRTGYSHFSSMCVVCHGAPGVERGEFGQGLNPEPPALSEVVPIYRPEEVYWILEHGIKMTGMPAFGPTHSEEALRAITAFVLQLPEMMPEEYQAWGERTEAGTPMNMASMRRRKVVTRIPATDTSTPTREGNWQAPYFLRSLPRYCWRIRWRGPRAAILLEQLS